jgi:hypothetical protein
VDQRMTELLNRRCGVETNFSKDLLPVTKPSLYCFHVLGHAFSALAQPFCIPGPSQMFSI